MSLFVYGISHKTASIETREQFVIPAEMLAGALKALQQDHHLAEVLVLSTCNRLEIYAVDVSPDHCLQWFSDYFSMSYEKLKPLLYFYEEDAAIEHALQVASGIDSMIIGEPQILGQLKTAYQAAKTAGTLGKQLGHLCPFVFSTTKKIRTQTHISQYPVSVAYVAVNLAKQKIVDLKSSTILLVGAGETIELIAQYLFDYGVTQLIFANRTLEKSASLAYRFGAKSIAIREIPASLLDADAVFTSTASQLPILGKGLIERVIKKRHDKPLLMIDLALPRDIEPEVAELAPVTLYNLDDLQNTIQENQNDRLKAAHQAQALIAGEIENFKKWQNTLGTVPLICAYRDRTEKISAELMAAALEDLKKGKAAEEVIVELTRQLSNKLLHQTSVNLREAAYEGDEATLKAASKLLGL